MRRARLLAERTRFFPAVLALGVVGCNLLEEEPGQCSTGFNDPAALAQIVDGAASTFAFPTGRDASGRLEACDERIHDSCWTYREQCDEHWIRVEPLTLGHFHLNPDDDDVQVGICESEFGLFTGTSDDCTLLDPTLVPRTLFSHTLDDWIVLWVEDGVTSEPVSFDLRRVTVEADKPIQLWVRKTDGTWLCWDRLDHSTAWEVAEWADNILEVRIRGADSGYGPYAMGGFALSE